MKAELISNERRFSISAKTYDQHSRPQQSLIHELADALPESTPARILELGSGTGKLTRRLMKQYPAASIDAVDLSSGMIEHSRINFSGHPRVSWMVGDAQTFQASEPYPLIVSSAALHWTGDLRETFVRIYQNMESGGIFALGMMLNGTLRELRRIRSTIAPEKVFGTRLPTFEETAETLQMAGFVLRKTERFDQRFTYPDSRAFLRAIHEQGVTGGSLDRGYIPLTRKEVRTLIQNYQAECETGDGVYASYETAVFIAEKN